eukprot:g3543.t1
MSHPRIAAVDSPNVIELMQDHWIKKFLSHGKENKFGRKNVPASDDKRGRTKYYFPPTRLDFKDKRELTSVENTISTGDLKEEDYQYEGLRWVHMALQTLEVAARKARLRAQFAVWRKYAICYLPSSSQLVTCDDDNTTISTSNSTRRVIFQSVEKKKSIISESSVVKIKTNSKSDEMVERNLEFVVTPTAVSIPISDSTSVDKSSLEYKSTASNTESLGYDDVNLKVSQFEARMRRMRLLLFRSLLHRKYERLLYQTFSRLRSSKLHKESKTLKCTAAMSKTIAVQTEAEDDTCQTYEDKSTITDDHTTTTSCASAQTIPIFIQERKPEKPKSLGISVALQTKMESRRTSVSTQTKTESSSASVSTQANIEPSMSSVATQTNIDSAQVSADKLLISDLEREIKELHSSKTSLMEVNLHLKETIAELIHELREGPIRNLRLQTRSLENVDITRKTKLRTRAGATTRRTKTTDQSNYYYRTTTTTESKVQQHRSIRSSSQSMKRLRKKESELQNLVFTTPPLRIHLRLDDGTHT